MFNVHLRNGENKWVNKQEARLLQAGGHVVCVIDTEKKENVTFLGVQNGPGGRKFVLVNNEKGSTVKYNAARHNIINMDGYVRFVVGIGSGRNG